MKKDLLYILITRIMFVVLIYSCESEIFPELNDAAEIIVVDAWIDQKMEKQEIKITRSQPYFENSYPSKISDAIVHVEDLSNGKIYHFTEGPASYYWDPVDTPFGEAGHHYKLMVKIKGETFEAYSSLGRVPPIDSITFNYKPDDILVKEEYYMAEFMATDPDGIGDTYWIKAWKNGIYLGKPNELNMTYDAGFTPGQSVDGVPFITLIRKEFINPFDEHPEKENSFLPPYLVGDSVYVEIHSIDNQAFDFLFEVYYQINRPGGFAELFSVPLANSKTNLMSTDENSVTQVGGFFNVAAVSSRGRRLTQEMADMAKSMAE